MSDKIERIIDALRKKILESAIRGELVPQNPEDEPASKLLERIAEERERLIKEKKIKKPKSSSCIFRRDGHFYESINGGEPTCIDEEIPFEIPNSWEWVRLNSLGEIIGGGTPSTSIPAYWDGGIPWITPADMRNNRGKYISRGSKDISELGVAKSSTRVLPAGSVVFSSRAPIGYVAITENELYTNQGFKSVSFFTEGHQDFIYHALIGLTEDIKQRASGTTFAEISGSEFGTTLIPLPPKRESSRIVKEIESYYSALEKIQDSRARYKRILSETPTSLRQQLIQAAIQGQLVPQNPNDEPASVLLERIAQERTAKLGKKAAKSMSRIERRGSKTYELFPDGSEKDISDEIPFEIPDSWEWCRLSYISNGLQYGTSQKSNSTGKYAVLRMGNIQNGEIDFSDLVYSNNDVDFSKLELKNGDVLFNRTNSPEWVGKTAIFRNHKTPCIFAGYLIRINQSEQIIGAYLNYFLNSSCARKQGNEVVSLAVNQANISGAKLSDYFIPIPPLLEQHRIVEKLDALLKLV